MTNNLTKTEKNIIDKICYSYDYFLAEKSLKSSLKSNTNLFYNLSKTNFIKYDNILNYLEGFFIQRGIIIVDLTLQETLLDNFNLISKNQSKVLHGLIINCKGYVLENEGRFYYKPNTSYGYGFQKIKSKKKQIGIISKKAINRDLSFISTEFGRMLPNSLVRVDLDLLNFNKVEHTLKTPINLKKETKLNLSPLLLKKKYYQLIK
jgi:hypothetical protein